MYTTRGRHVGWCHNNCMLLNSEFPSCRKQGQKYANKWGEQWNYYQQIEVETELQPFGRHIFQLHILEWKCLHFGSNSSEVCSQGFDWQWIGISSVNSLAPNRRQAIIWTSDGFVYWHIYASLGLNELNFAVQNCIIQAGHFAIIRYIGTKRWLYFNFIIASLSFVYDKKHWTCCSAICFRYSHNS